MNDRQTSFDQFDTTRPPRCKKRFALNGFVKNCCSCPHVSRKKETMSCSLKGKKITTIEKYALPAWKELRDRVLLRDGHACAICSGTETLHIHHIDGDNTNDEPGNLITLCPCCHSRVHSELKKPGGRSRVMHVIGYFRGKRSTGRNAEKTG
jgi:5-methylcytosine-specific restriction endonuclease McrA